MPQSWKEIQIGWGIQRIPKDIAQQLCCSECHCGGVLFTDQDMRIKFTGNTRQYGEAYRNMLDRVRNRTFCKFHAIWYFGDPE